MSILSVPSVRECTHPCEQHRGELTEYDESNVERKSFEISVPTHITLSHTRRKTKVTKKMTRAKIISKYNRISRKKRKENLSFHR